MPNITLYGFGPIKARELRDKIKPVMQELGHADDGVMTIIQSNVVFCNDAESDAPYLRICSTKAEELGRIHEAFRAAGINEDSEFLILNGFAEKSPSD